MTKKAKTTKKAKISELCSKKMSSGATFVSSIFELQSCFLTTRSLQQLLPSVSQECWSQIHGPQGACLCLTKCMWNSNQANATNFNKSQVMAIASFVGLQDCFLETPIFMW